MNTLLKGKRGNLILAILVTGIAAVGIWNVLIRSQRSGLKVRSMLLAETKEKVQAAKRSLGLSEALKAGLGNSRRMLESMEFKMPSTDVYRWAARTFDSLQTNDVDVISLEAPRLGQPNTLPTVPYKAASFSISGTAYYHDFGKFLANLENNFPHLRLRRLELKATHFGETADDEQEKLGFKIEIVALVKESSTEP